MSRTPTLPPDDQRMWRRAKARAHPDTGGEHELFVWLSNVENVVCNSTAWTKPEPEAPRRPYHQSPPRSERRVIYEDGRVPFPLGSILEELTSLALSKAGALGDPHRRILLLLEDCYALEHLVHEEQRGASYKRLAYIAHLSGMSKSERIEWYRISETIPLTDRHAGHLIKKLKEAV